MICCSACSSVTPSSFSVIAAVLEVAIERDVDAAVVADEGQDVPDAGVDEVDDQRLGIRRVQDGSAATSRLLAQLLDLRPRRRGFDRDRAASARVAPPSRSTGGSTARIPGPCGTRAAPRRAGRSLRTAGRARRTCSRRRPSRVRARSCSRGGRGRLERLPVEADRRFPVAGFAGGLAPRRRRDPWRTPPPHAARHQNRHGFHETVIGSLAHYLTVRSAG